MRRMFVAGGILTLATVVGLAVKAGVPAAQGGGASSHAVSKETYEGWKKTQSNWGRWGKDDQIGAMNLVTPAKRKAAAALVKEGFAVSLASPPDNVKSVDNPSPYEHKMNGIGGDQWGVSYHGITHTHLDGLDHINENGVFYNGYHPVAEEVIKADRHFKNSIDNLKAGIFTRAVLYDIPRLKNVPYLAPSTPIYAEDLEAWEKKSGVKVGPGDVLLVRTGVWAQRKVVGAYARGRNGKDAGLHPSVIPWLKQRDIAIMGSDHPQYMSPPPADAPIIGAAHDFALIYLGVSLIDNADLEALAEACAARNRWEFLLTMAPIPYPGGTGSPINPVAIF